MANKMYSEQYVQNIADAIRYVNGKSSETYTIQEMAAEIEAIGREEEQYDCVLEDSCAELISHASKVCDYKMTNEFKENSSLTSIKLYGTTSIGSHAFAFTSKTNGDYNGHLESLYIDMTNYTGNVLTIKSYAFGNALNEQTTSLTNNRLINVTYTYGGITYKYIGTSSIELSDNADFSPFVATKYLYDESTGTVTTMNTPYTTHGPGDGDVVFDPISARPYYFDTTNNIWHLYFPAIKVRIGINAFCNTRIDWLPWIIEGPSSDCLNELSDVIPFVIFDRPYEYTVPQIPKMQSRGYFDNSLSPAPDGLATNIYPWGSESGTHVYSNITRFPLYVNSDGTGYDNHGNVIETFEQSYISNASSQKEYNCVYMEHNTSIAHYYNKDDVRFSSPYNRIEVGPSVLTLPSLQNMAYYTFYDYGPLEELNLPGMQVIGGMDFTFGAWERVAPESTTNFRRVSDDLLIMIKTNACISKCNNLKILRLPILDTIWMAASYLDSGMAIIEASALEKVVIGDGTHVLNFYGVNGRAFPAFANGQEVEDMATISMADIWQTGTTYVFNKETTCSLYDLTLNVTGMNYMYYDSRVNESYNSGLKLFCPQNMTNPVKSSPILAYIGVTTTAISTNSTVKSLDVNGETINVTNKFAYATYDGKDWYFNKTKWVEWGTDGSKRPVIRVPETMLATFRADPLTMFNMAASELTNYANPFNQDLFQAIEGT